MAMHPDECERGQQQQQHSSSFLLDALYCEEERWEEKEEEEEEEEVTFENNSSSTHSPKDKNHSVFLEQDLFWEHEELLRDLSKEEGQQKQSNVKTDPYLFLARQEAAEWIVKVNTRYGFSVVTAVLAIDYLDRFLCSPCFQKDKPWMVQLVSVACLSLAAKVEETQVPLLFDFQVEDAKYMFEPKTIQRMELLVLSVLKWKMHPVSPLSFVDHIMRRLGLENHLHWEFHRRCVKLLLSVVSDSRFMGTNPSVLATATVMHVIDQIEPIEYQNQLLGVLGTTNKEKEKVKECYGLIGEKTNAHDTKSSHRKLLLCEPIIPSSPSGAIDGAHRCECGSSNDLWSVGSSSVSVSVSEAPPLKKNKTQDQMMPMLFSLNRDKTEMETYILHNVRVCLLVLTFALSGFICIKLMNYLIME